MMLNKPPINKTLFWLARPFALLWLIGCLNGCPTESHRVLQPQVTAAANTSYHGPKYTLMVGNFRNNSAYLRGIFSDGIDRLGDQAKTILKTHLQQSGRFVVVDRENLEHITRESRIRGKTQRLEGAEIAVTGDVTEFGRRVVGDTQLFGVLGRGKRQLAYAKVALNIVDTDTSEIIYSSQGAGEYTLANRQIVGTGSTAGYDSTLNAKVLNLAIMEAVENLIKGLERGSWSPGKTR